MAYRVRIPISLGTNKTGLALKAQLYNSSGVTVGSEITSGFTERANGDYAFDYASVPDGFVGDVVVYTGTLPGGYQGFEAISPANAIPAGPLMEASAYTVPPAAATVASAVRTNLATELSRLDVAVSGVVSAVEDIPAPPSAAAIASVVWTPGFSKNVDTVGGLEPEEVDTVADVQAGLTAQGYTTARSTKLDFLDTSVLSRMATFTYTTPPTAAAVASAVRTNLATELSRIDVGIGTRLADSAYTVPPTTSQILVAFGTRLDAIDAGIEEIPVPPTAEDIAEAAWTYEGRDVQTIGGHEPVEADTVADVQQALTAQGYTTARAGKIDVLDGPVEADLRQMGGVDIDTPLAPGNPTTFLQKQQYTAQRLKRTVIDKQNRTVKVLADDGTTLTTQTYVSDSDVESVGPVL